MAEAAAPAARPGQALKLYQMLGILVAGWLLGRLPGLLDENAAERARLEQALAPAATSAVETGPAPPELVASADLAARIATQVAVDVAEATVARLLAAGWGPPAAGRVQQLPAAPLPRAAAPPRETVVRVITEARPPDAETLAALGWVLPPAAGAPRPATETVPAAPPAEPDNRLRAHALATLGYAQIRDGNRREGVQSLSRALLLDPEADQAAAWAADVRRLTRRWSVSTYSLSREGTGDPLAAGPVLGGGQAGAAVAFTIDPLARRPIALAARIASAAGPDGALDPETAEAALGVRVQPFPKVPLAVDVERRFALGAFARNAWAARVSGGAGARTRLAGQPFLWDGYGEAGVVGEKRWDVYAGGQARGAFPLISFGNLSLDAGAGLWAAGQRTVDGSAGRVDLGPSARIAMRPWPFSAQIDYRIRAVGNAEPDTGLALTVAGNF